VGRVRSNKFTGSNNDFYEEHKSLCEKYGIIQNVLIGFNHGGLVLLNNNRNSSHLPTLKEVQAFDAIKKYVLLNDCKANWVTASEIVSDEYLSLEWSPSEFKLLSNLLKIPYNTTNEKENIEKYIVKRNDRIKHEKQKHADLHRNERGVDFNNNNDEGDEKEVEGGGREEEEADLDFGFTYDCTTCRAAFFQESLLHDHLKTVHNVEEPVKCIVTNCGQYFQTLEEMNLHCQNEHPGAVEQYAVQIQLLKEIGKKRKEEKKKRKKEEEEKETYMSRRRKVRKVRGEERRGGEEGEENIQEENIKTCADTTCTNTNPSFVTQCNKCIENNIPNYYWCFNHTDHVHPKTNIKNINKRKRTNYLENYDSELSDDV